LAKGDFSLTAGLLSTFSVINAIAQWGSEKVQATYLSSFANDAEINATFAIKLTIYRTPYYGSCPFCYAFKFFIIF